MRPAFLVALPYLLTIGLAKTEAAEPEFAHFLEPGFPFAEITVDGRDLGEGFPEDNLTPRGLVVRLAEDTYIAYDTDLCRVAVAWKGGFLTAESLATMSYQQPKKKKGGGQKVVPSVVGTPIFATGLYPGVQLGSEPKFEDPRPAGKDPKEIGRGALAEARWLSASPFGRQVLVAYGIGHVLVKEIPFALEDSVICRYIEVSPHPDYEISFVLGTGYCAIRNRPHGSKLIEGDGVQILVLPKSAEHVKFTVLQSARPIPDEIRTKAEAPASPILKPYWPASVITSELRGGSQGAYAVDSIGLPIENPHRRNIRPSGIDFFSDGRALVVTYDGDLWEVSGLADETIPISWRRIAGGLHEPNSVRIRDDREIFVFGRNGITHFEKLESVGEVRYYQTFCRDFWQSADTRDFAHSMAIADDGTFFITKGGQQNDFASKHSGRTLKISPDGKKIEVFASGLRNAYLAIRPGTDEIYASDQQGHWVPATPVHRIVEGGYYGFQPAAPWDVPEPPVTPPLCWIPHAVAGSGLGPVWADEQRFGPLSDSLVYLDFRRPGLLRTYLNDREGQAATVPMPTQFDFPLLKGAVNPVDGQLYLVGFQIWGTSAKQIRGMARVRYTGKPSLLPTRVVAGKNAIALRFEQPLDPSVANFTVRRWNYKRSGNYGSGHYRPDGKAGEELLALSGMEFSADRRSVLIATPELFPVQQLAVSYDLRTRSGERFSNAAYLTLHKIVPLDLAAEGFPGTDLASLAIAARPGTAGEQKPAEPSIERGRAIFSTIGCFGCHSNDGSTNGKSGPTWKGLAGSQRQLSDGGTAEATSAYLRESILDPTAKVTKGYNPKDVGMPSYRGILSDADIDSVILYIESLAKRK